MADHQRYDLDGLLCVGRETALPGVAGHKPGLANIKLYRNGPDTLEDNLEVVRSRYAGNQRHITATRLGSRIVRGSVPFWCGVTDIWPFLSSAMGTGDVAVTPHGAGGEHLHTFKRSSTSFKSLTFGRIMDTDTGVDPVQYKYCEMYSGCVVDSLHFHIARGESGVEEFTVTADIVGQASYHDHVLTSATAPTFAQWFGAPTYDVAGFYNALQASIYWPDEATLSGTIIEATLDVYFGVDPKFILNGTRSHNGYLRANHETDAVRLSCRMYMENFNLADYWWGYGTNAVTVPNRTPLIDSDTETEHGPMLAQTPYGSLPDDTLACKIEAVYAKAVAATDQYLQLRIPQLALTGPPTWERGGEQGYLIASFDAVGLYDTTALTDFVAVLATGATAAEPAGSDATAYPAGWNF